MSYRKERRFPKEERQVQSVTFAEYHNPGELRMLSTSRLSSGQPYQRHVDEAAVVRLLREWDDRLLEPVIVSFRDGKFNVVDGQHRIAAAKKRSEGQEVMMPCRIYTGLSYEQEAELCYKLDRAQRRLSLPQATNALMESGVDPETTEIRRLLESEGFVWALGKKHGEAYEIVATRAVINAYRSLGGAAFSRMFALLRDTWRGEPASLSASMISGMSLFLKTYETELRDNLFVKRLSAVTPEEITRRGKADFSTSRYALRFARVLLEKYNGQRGGHKLSYRFPN